MPTSEEEAGNLMRSTKKVKTGGFDSSLEHSMGEMDEKHFKERHKSSYRDKVMGIGSVMSLERDELDPEEDASDDVDFEDDV